jgi:hypothetical protein
MAVGGFLKLGQPDRAQCHCSFFQLMPDWKNKNANYRRRLALICLGEELGGITRIPG